MAAITNRQVNVYINSGEAAKAYDVLIKREKLLNEELAKTADPKRIKALNAELDKLKEPIDRATKKMKGEMLPTIRDLEAGTKKFLNEFKKTGSPESLANFQKFQAELQKAKAQLNGLDQAQKGLTTKGIFAASFWANLAAGAVTGFLQSFSGFFGDVVDEALNADDATRRLESTLSNLGRGDSFDRIARKAEELAKQFRYLDNDDIVAVFNKLIDYGKLTEREMNDLLPVIINFAAKSKISIDESASVIIKALEGSAKGLKEYGINVKDGENATERLSIIMTTLKEKVDGAGEAFENSARGGFAVARQELNNLKEDIGTGLLPVLNKLLSALLTGGRNIKTFFEAIGDEFSGKNGFITIALRSVDPDDPKTKIAIDDIREGVIRSFTILSEQYESDELKKAQDNVINTIKKSITSFRNKISELQEGSGRGGQDEAKSAKISIIAREQALQEIEDSLNKQLDKTLGISQPGSGGKDDAADKLKRAQEAYAAFLKKIKELNAEFDAGSQEGFAKELALLVLKTDKLKEEAAKHKDNKEALLLIDELYRKEALALIEKYSILDKQKIEKASKEQAEILAKGYKKLLEMLQAGAAILNEDALAKRDLAILQARGDEKLRLQKIRLKQEEEAEVAAAIKKARAAGVAEEQIQNTIALIRQKYRDQEEKLETDMLKAKINQVVSYVQQAVSIFTIFGKIQTDRENASLEEDRRINDAKKANLERRLKAGTITRLNYDREMQKLDRDREKKENEIALKQFERNKREKLAAAIINTAEGISEAIPNPILIAFAAAIGAAQIAAIISTKPPKFAEGSGPLPGRSHSSGGNAVMDGSGNKIAEVEAGEGIVNKRTMADRRKVSVSGTPGQIISRLNGLHGVEWESGATLIPGYRYSNPQRMNFSAMKKMYALGGRFETNNIQSQSNIDLSVIEHLSDSVNNLNTILANGISAYTIITQHEKTQERINDIRKDATMV